MKSAMTFFAALIICYSLSALADDCAGIRSAIMGLPNSGGEVKVHEGTYNCSAPIIIDRSNVRLVGAGRDKVIIRLAERAHSPLLIIGTPQTILNEQGNFVAAHRVDHIQVSGISLDGDRRNHDPSKECGESSCDGNASSVRNNGITIRGASNVSIVAVTAHSMISGGLVTEKYCDNLFIQDFESYDNFFDGFAGYEATSSEFSNLSLHDNRGAGISIDINFNDNVIRDSNLVHNGDVGIFARNLTGNQFIRLIVQDSGSYGVFMANAGDVASCARNNRFEDVKIIRSRLDGLRLNNVCFGNQIEGASDLSGNLGDAFSEAAPGILFVGRKVILK